MFKKLFKRCEHDWDSAIKTTTYEYDHKGDKVIAGCKLTYICKKCKKSRRVRL